MTEPRAGAATEDEEDDRVLRTLVRYTRGADNRDVEGWISLFTEDARLTPRSGGDFSGRPAIRKWFEDLFFFGTRRPDRRSLHLCGNADITISGDTAEVVSDVVVYEWDADHPRGIHQINQYFDRLVRVDGEWLFAERRIEAR